MGAKNMADTLIEEQITEFRYTFDHFDENKDQHLSVQEFSKLLSSLGQLKSEAELHEMMKEAYQNEDMKQEDFCRGIGFGQFLCLMAKTMKDNDTEEELIEAFKVFDRDSDGFISAAELRFSMTNLGENLVEAEVNERIREADIDGDNQINYDEFVKMMMAK